MEKVKTAAKPPAASKEKSWSDGVVFPIGRKLRTYVKDGAGEKITILSYNILNTAGKLSQYYYWCPEEFLTWEYRRKTLLKEIAEYNPDVLCLQECDNFREFWNPELSKKGYDFVYKQRPNGKQDGCATFYKRDKFMLYEKHELAMNEIALDYPVDQRPRFVTNNVALFLVLQSFSSGRNLVVGNIHIFWNAEKAEDVQIAQARRFFDKAHELSSSNEHPVFLCGDYNSWPRSTVYHIARGNSLKENPQAGLSWGYLSAYGCYDSPTPALPHADAPFTTYKVGNINCIDYIFYSAAHARVAQLLELPDDQKLKAFDGCPNKRFSSDHLALMAEFLLLPPAAE